MSGSLSPFYLFVDSRSYVNKQCLLFLLENRCLPPFFRFHGKPCLFLDAFLIESLDSLLMSHFCRDIHDCTDKGTIIHVTALSTKGGD